MKYWMAARAAFLQQLSEKGQLCGRLLLFVIVVLLFKQIFVAVEAASSRICYLAMTEAVIISAAPLVLTILSDIRTNQTAYFLLRPVDYCTFRSIEALGNASFRYIILFAAATLFSFWLRGTPNFVSFFVGFLGLVLYTQMSLVIGLLSFWMREIKTLLYFNLTATFCFGGLIVPLSDYPAWMQKIAFFTPYPWVLYWPAALFSGSRVTAVAPLFWLLWMAIFWILGRLLFAAYRKRLVMEGG
ncbi:MAG: hypothetical protein S4CHLAM81_12910 [Chlamydiales bacterium]|nr:hypothetical protein [Chlamydiales bacterium]MCH9636066.1 hypothetical protein [Chlamydiales bacterium]MCH9703223.1 hypothetical protein [Chlamydiota bacterium]